MGPEVDDGKKKIGRFLVWFVIAFSLFVYFSFALVVIGCPFPFVENNTLTINTATLLIIFLINGWVVLAIFTYFLTNFLVNLLGILVLWGDPLAMRLFRSIIEHGRRNDEFWERVEKKLEEVRE